MGLKVNLYKNLKNFDLNVDFEIGNESLAIVGHSGSGKSMTLKMISGIESQDRGEIILNNKDITNTRVQERKVGFLFQNFGLFPHLSVINNILLPLRNKDKNFAMELLKRFKVDSLADSYPNEISGGEKQRVALARLFSINPEIILLDEPFSSLDTHLKWDIENDLNLFLQNYNKPMVCVTHNIDEAMRMCKKILVLKSGKQVFFGSVDKIFQEPMNVELAKIVGVLNIFEDRLLGLYEDKFSTDKIEDSFEFNVEYKYDMKDSKGNLFVFKLENGNFIKCRLNLNNGQEVKKLYYSKDKALKLKR